ncbi:Protein CBG15581 [Caenorhabditis briggsae]|uniref:Protein CBG15581 n=1 Tax=Caenorhabditis briggsae TaxID=6238 RepID=A8XM37_CAEBR|nr:Protein CBG15581 [Caenorhabditis briggsae]CAP33712.2 Protein CBG15581 [Caenorhabditis briggsae]
MKDSIFFLLLLSSTVLAQTGFPLPGAGVSSSTPTGRIFVRINVLYYFLETSEKSVASSLPHPTVLAQKGSTDQTPGQIMDGSLSISPNIISTASSNGKSSEAPAGTTVSTEPTPENSAVITDSSVEPSHETSTQGLIKITSSPVDVPDSNISTQSPSESTASSNGAIEETSNTVKSNVAENTTNGTSGTFSDDTKKSSVRTSALPVESSDGTSTPSSVETDTVNSNIGSDSSDTARSSSVGPSVSADDASSFTNSGSTSSSFNGVSKVVFEGIIGETPSTSESSTGGSGDSNATTPSSNDSELHHETTAFSFEHWLRQINRSEDSTDHPIADTTNETTSNSVQTEKATTTKCVDGEGDDCFDEEETEEYDDDDDSEYDYEGPSKPREEPTKTPKSEKLESTTRKRRLGNWVYGFEDKNDEDDNNIAKFAHQEEHLYQPKYAAHHGSEDVSVEPYGKHEHKYMDFSNGFANKRFTAISIISAMFVFFL